MPKHGKKYLEAAKLIEHGRYYSPEEAIALVKQTHFAEFDATVELHLRTGLDPRHADQQVRGVVLLPSGTGKRVSILVFAEGDGDRIAREAGADYVGSDDLINKIQEGWFDFDVAIATPAMMRKVGRLGRVLGTRGLMPNPKAGTIVAEEDLGRVLEETRKGRVEYRVDKTANIHVPIGKVSFDRRGTGRQHGRRHGSDRQGQAGRCQGNLPAADHRDQHHGPGVRVDAAAAMAMKTA